MVGFFFVSWGWEGINEEIERIANDVIDNYQMCCFPIFGEVWRGVVFS